MVGEEVGGRVVGAAVGAEVGVRVVGEVVGEEVGALVVGLLVVGDTVGEVGAAVVVCACPPEKVSNNVIINAYGVICLPEIDRALLLSVCGSAARIWDACFAMLTRAVSPRSLKLLHLL